MAKQITTKRFAINVVLSITAQVISMAVSCILTLVVPKFIDEYQYAYWQTYVLYVGYVGVLHFGLLDGLVLRYSKYDYEELDKKRILSQLQILFTGLSLISLTGMIISFSAVGGVYGLILIFVAVGTITKNLVTYGSYMFQITNRISKYVVTAISQRLVYGLLVVLLLILRVNNFYWFIIVDLLGDFVALAISMAYNRELFFGKSILLKEALKELRINIAAGIILMLANWSSMLMVGGAKMIIQWHWGDLLFGKVSFAFSMSNVFLAFVTAISVVLFPSLQRIDKYKLPQMYKDIRNAISLILFFAMIFYFPCCWLLKLWLPKYSESLNYLGILLPLIVFSAKVSLLTNNYLKVYRKEKSMLLVNAVTIAIGLGLFVLCAYVFNNLTALLICVVFIIMFNAVLSEIIVMKTIHIKLIKKFIVEALMTIGFILCTSLFNLWMGGIIFAGLFAIYAAINYKSILEIFNRIFKKSKIKNEKEKITEKAVVNEKETIIENIDNCDNKENDL